MATITIVLDDDTQRILDKLVKEASTSELDVITEAIRVVNETWIKRILGPK